MSNNVSGAITELQIINYIFQKNSIRIISDNGITEEYFTLYKEHIKYLIDFYNKYNQLPSKETFQGRFADNFEWLNVTDPDDYLISHLKEAKMFRDVIKDYNSIGELLKEEKTDIAISQMSAIAQKFYSQKGVSCVDLIDNAKERYNSYIERLNNPEKAFVTTGLKELDEVIGGWDMLNETAIISARTGVGKSWLLIYFAYCAAKQGLRVGYYSGEMESEFIGYRFDTFAGNIANGSLTHGNSEIKNQYETYLSNLSTVIKGHIYCITPDDIMFNGSVTVSKLKAFIEKYDLQMLCIDQFSLLDDEQKGKSVREQAINISKSLRALQRLKKIPILCAVQLNREDTEENGPSSKNIAESDRIGQDATTILFIENKGDNVRITIGKSRNAKTGDKLNYMWNKNMGIMHYIPTENDATKGEGSEELLSSYQDDKSDNIF